MVMALHIYIHDVWRPRRRDDVMGDNPFATGSFRGGSVGGPLTGSWVSGLGSGIAPINEKQNEFFTNTYGERKVPRGSIPEILMKSRGGGA
jgi:hypothetical protein